MRWNKEKNNSKYGQFSRSNSRPDLSFIDDIQESLKPVRAKTCGLIPARTDFYKTITKYETWRNINPSTWMKQAQRPTWKADTTLTQQGILHYLAHVYVRLGSKTPTTLTRKHTLKLQWNQMVPDSLAKKWKVWIHKIPSPTKPRPRSILQYKEEIINIELHLSADASSREVYNHVWSDTLTH